MRPLPVVLAADPAALLARADEALYLAKRAGRDRVQAARSGPRAESAPALASRAS